MGKYKRILVAVDGSEPSLHALGEAFKLSTSWVTVVAVTPFYEGDLRLLGVPMSDRLIREPCETALAQAQEMADEAGALIRPVCERGVPDERIVQLADLGSRDLIVMGARGHSVLENLLVGSVSRRVIGFTSKDILVVPSKGVVGWEKILLATDGSPRSRAAADRALELAQIYGSELLVVSVQDFPAAIRGVAPMGETGTAENLPGPRGRGDQTGRGPADQIRGGYPGRRRLYRHRRPGAGIRGESHRHGLPRQDRPAPPAHGPGHRTGHRPRPLPGAGGEGVKE